MIEVKEVKNLSKRVYEFIKIIETFYEWKEKENNSKKMKEKLYYKELQKEILELLTTASELLKIEVAELFHLYETYLKAEKIEIDLYNQLTIQEEKRYFELIRKNTLYKQIMGKTAEKRLDFLEILLNEYMDISTVGKDIYSLTEKIDDWQKKNQELYNLNKISLEECLQNERDISYLSDYYWSILNGTQEKQEELLRTRVKSKLTKKE